MMKWVKSEQLQLVSAARMTLKRFPRESLARPRLVVKYTLHYSFTELGNICLRSVEETMTQMLLLVDRYKLAQSHLRKQNHGTVPVRIDRVAYNRHLGGYLDLDVYEALEQLSKACPAAALQLEAPTAGAEALQPASLRLRRRNLRWTSAELELLADALVQCQEYGCFSVQVSRKFWFLGGDKRRSVEAVKSTTRLLRNAWEFITERLRPWSLWFDMSPGRRRELQVECRVNARGTLKKMTPAICRRLDNLFEWNGRDSEEEEEESHLSEETPAPSAPQHLALRGRVDDQDAASMSSSTGGRPVSCDQVESVVLRVLKERGLIQGER